MVELRKLRIGLLQESAYTSRYMRDVVTWAGEQDDLEMSHLIIYGPPEKTGAGQRGPKDNLTGLRKAALRCIQFLEQSVLAVYHGGMHRDHGRQFPIDHLVANTIQIRPSSSKSGCVSFPEDEIAKVRAAGCDILIHGASGVFRGDILKASTLGVLALRHGDNRVNRGGPAGFWETYFGWPATGFTIQRLTQEADGGDVLMRGSHETKWFFLLNQAELFSKANFYFKELLRKVARERTLPPAEESFPYSGELVHSPSLSECLGYVFRIAARVATRFIRKGAYILFRYQDRWYLSISFTDWRRANLWRAMTPKPPSGRFLADPFVWEHEGKTFCLAEDYSFRERIGRISAFQIDGQSTTPPEVVLAEPFHLSFPYLFEFAGTIYMCPECSASRQIRLYQSIGFPHKWQFVKAIMTDVSAVDSMIFEKGDRWWMLTNLDLQGRGGFRSELYLFSAASPLSETWVPHPANPLKIDPAGGRNAGLLRDGHRLYRAGQVQGFEHYGAGIRLYEICSLSLESYQERLIGEIHPGFRDGLLGTHHISSTGAVTVVDGYRREVTR
jgi:hypothetical protein